MGAPSAYVDPPASGSLEARTSLALKILAAIHVAGIVFALIPIPVSTLYTVSFHAAAGVLAVAYVVIARALDRRRPWAVRAVRAILAVLMASGVAIVIASFDQGRLQIPFDAILAAWAFLGRSDLSLARRTEVRSVAAFGGVVLALGVMLFGKPVFDWGGTLDQHPQDLVASLHVDCGPGGGGRPESIHISYDWSWGWQGPLPSSNDSIVIGWTGDDAEGHPLYTVGTIPDNPRGIRPGHLDEPSFAMAMAAKAESRGSWQWGIELGQYGLKPGSVDMELTKASEAAVSPATLSIRATYVHLGLWRSDAVATCTW